MRRPGSGNPEYISVPLESLNTALPVLPQSVFGSPANGYLEVDRKAVGAFVSKEGKVGDYVTAYRRFVGLAASFREVQGLAVLTRPGVEGGAPLLESNLWKYTRSHRGNEVGATVEITVAHQVFGRAVKQDGLEMSTLITYADAAGVQIGPEIVTNKHWQEDRENDGSRLRLFLRFIP